MPLYGTVGRPRTSISAIDLVAKRQELVADQAIALSRDEAFPIELEADGCRVVEQT